jgi:predicted ATPase/class 3 adenylate cyclase
LTVVFCDLAGFTALNERLDPEEVQALMARIREEARRIFTAQGGVINQFVGDEVMGLFGVPLANEDDPVRAVRSALEFHELLRGLSAEVEGRIGAPLRLHTGVNTGPVVVSLREDERGRYEVTGDAVNVAAHLRTLARAGAVLVGPATRARCEGFFEFKALDATRLKGKSEPVVPALVVRATGARHRLEATRRRGLSPFLGRRAEQAALAAALARLRRGEGGLVSVRGDAGLGKSRLLHEFRRGLPPRDFTVLEGRCTAQGGQTPYLPFADTLRRALGLSNRSAPEESARRAVAGLRAVAPETEAHLPYLLHLLALPAGGYPLPATAEGETLRAALERALELTLRSQARKQPTLLMLEDWHWADDASDHCLHRLLPEFVREPLLVAVLYRPEYGKRWPSLPRHTPLDLAPLEREDTARLLAARFGVQELPPGFAGRVHEHAGGNPFFAEEVSLSLLEEGTVVVRGGRAELARPIEALRLPGTVQAVIRGRVDRLEPEARELLTLAAVIGREFERRLLERLVPAPRRMALLLDILTARDLIRPHGEEGGADYRFRHTLTQVVVYETLLRQQRKELHARVGRAIEELYAERLASQAQRLAYHFLNSDEVDKALRYLLQASRDVARLFAFTDAVHHARTALNLLDGLPPTPEREALRLEFTFIWAAFGQGEGSSALVAALRQAASAVEGRASLELQARLHRYLGWSYTMLGQTDDGLASLQHCLEIARRSGNSAQTAHALTRLGRCYIHHGSNREALSYLEQGHPLLVESGNDVEVSLSLAYQAQALGNQGRFAEARQRADRAVALGRALENTGCVTFALYCGSWVEAAQGNIRPLERLVAENGTVMRRLLLDWVLNNAQFKLGYLEVLSGAAAAGLRRMQDTLAVMSAHERTQLGRPTYDYEGMLAHGYLLAEDPRAEAQAQRALERPLTGNRPSCLAHLTLAFLAAQSARPDREAAETHYRACLREAALQEIPPELAVLQLYGAQLYRRLDDRVPAQEHLARARAGFSAMGMAWWLEKAEEEEAGLPR